MSAKQGAAMNNNRNPEYSNVYINGQPAPLAINEQLCDLTDDVTNLRREAEWTNNKLNELLDKYDEQMQALFETRELVDEALYETRELVKDALEEIRDLAILVSSREIRAVAA
jgi:hypothetical protein